MGQPPANNELMPRASNLILIKFFKNQIRCKCNKLISIVMLFHFSWLKFLEKELTLMPTITRVTFITRTQKMPEYSDAKLDLGRIVEVKSILLEETEPSIAPEPNLMIVAR